MIERVLNAERINAIINDPAVYPWVCGINEGPLDISGVLSDGKNVALFGEHGGVIFIYHAPGYYEAHTQVLPSGRGRWTLAMVNDALRWMFTKTDAVEIVTRVPHGNTPAKALVRAIHGEFEFTNKAGWIKDRLPIPADVYSLTIQRWIKTAPSLEESGQWFHDRLEEEYAATGKEIDQHDDDPNHDRFVGAAVQMILGGQPDKGVVFYNRWAAMSGYEQVRIIARDPLTIDIRDALIVVRNNNFRVI